MQMDFTTEGTSKLVICGRSPIDKNTIHLRFEEGEESNIQLIEFTTFIFLPGSQFDFGWFRFE
ncbi:hypothetical protein [Paenibacillus pseudetheri]|uniref:Uncharacterized protein n=1 Tax=Paenibacillus pseudetheri TaxID=2897682 RepID=A0ABM9BHX5_9BACL|nr:hypothetical protein [Paenibacillus pseudetheri]CAH1057707.1 hypothetical protein PAECIP111894_03879 [Paenibacillus pseudetheri]